MHTASEKSFYEIKEINQNGITFTNGEKKSFFRRASNKAATVKLVSQKGIYLPNLLIFCFFYC